MVGLLEPETRAASPKAPALPPRSAEPGVLHRLAMGFRQLARFAYELLTNV